MSFFFIMSLTIMMISFSFTRMKHPLAMGMTLLIQTVLISLVTGLVNKSVWFSYILFLIFLGAMLVLFIYVASLASNETFLISPTLMSLIFFPCLSILLIFMDPLMYKLKSSIEISFFQYTQLFNSIQFNLSMIYNPFTNNLTLFIIIYLLLTLIVVVKITSPFFGPLRLS